MGRRSLLARGIYNTLLVDGRFVAKAILNGAQYCLNATLNRGGLSAYQPVYVARPAGLFS